MIAQEKDDHEGACVDFTLIGISLPVSDDFRAEEELVEFPVIIGKFNQSDCVFYSYFLVLRNIEAFSLCMF